MIDRFGQVMLYVQDPHACAIFWTEKAGFVKLGEGDGTADDEQGIPWAEVAPTPASDTSLVLFQREAVARREPEMDLATPSLLFSSYDLQRTYDDFRAKGITTGALADMGGMKTFNFSDNEGHWFAIRQVEPPKE